MDVIVRLGIEFSLAMLRAEIVILAFIRRLDDVARRFHLADRIDMLRIGRFDMIAEPTQFLDDVLDFVLHGILG